MFCNILVTWGTMWQLLMLLAKFWRWLSTLNYEMASLYIFSKFYSLDLALWIEVQHRNRQFEAYLTFPNRWASCNPSGEISSCGLCVVINCVFNFGTTIVLSCVGLSLNSLSISSHPCSLITTAFRSHTEWSNSQRSSSVAIMTLPNTACTCHGLNCSRYVMYTLQTSKHCQNIAKLLPYPNIFILIYLKCMK